MKMRRDREWGKKEKILREGKIKVKWEKRRRNSVSLRWFIAWPVSGWVYALDLDECLCFFMRVAPRAAPVWMQSQP